MMKKVYAFCFSALFASSIMAQFPVMFGVDMTGQVVDANGVHIAGNFGDTDYDGTFENPSLVNWTPDAYQLTDPDMDMIYTVTLDLVAGRYEYKFLNGNDWPSEESIPAACQVGNGNGNREIFVTGTASTFICWESCAPCGDKTVRFRVDMSLVPDGVNPAGVSVAGDFQGWAPGATILTDADNNLVFERSVNVGSAGSIEFKYINGDDFLFAESVPTDCGVGPNSNRLVNLTETNTVLTAWCFSGCSTCQQPTMVTLKVDMSLQTVNANGVFVAGSIQSPVIWTPGDPNYQMTDDNSDGIYELTFGLAPGTYGFKFLNGNAWGTDESVPGDCNIGGNRQLIVSGETMEAQFCFQQCTSECIADPDPANITFRVNMFEEEVSLVGVFLISGSTSPAWQAGAVAMTDDNSDGVYECTVEMSGSADVPYKFINGDVNTPANEENSGLAECGIANGIGGFNRLHTRSGDAEVLDVVCFNACLDCVISVSELQVVEQLNVFPVPAQDQLTVSMVNPEAQVLTMRLVNMTGQVVLTTNPGLVKAGKQTFNLDVAALASGIYFLEIGNQNVNQVVRVAVR